MTSQTNETQPLLKEKPLTFSIRVKTFFLALKNRKTFLIYFILLIIFGIANAVAGRWNQLKFGDNYAFFNNQVEISTVDFLASL
jgi:hypothetical protein